MDKIDKKLREACAAHSSENDSIRKAAAKLAARSETNMKAFELAKQEAQDAYVGAGLGPIAVTDRLSAILFEEHTA